MNIVPFLFLCFVLMMGSTAVVSAEAVATAPPAKAGEPLTLEVSNQEDKKADEKMAQFLNDHGVSIEKAAEKPSVSEVEVLPNHAIVPPAADDMIVNSEDGAYFDMDEGIFIYLKNVRVRHPQLNMDCDKDLKIYLQPADKEKEKDGDKKPSDGGISGMGGEMKFNFDGGIKRIVASGNVIAKGEDKGKKYEARADHIIFDVKTGEMLMTGGYPLLKDEKNGIQCIELGGTIRRAADGKVFFKGRIRSTFKDVDTQNGFNE